MANSRVFKTKGNLITQAYKKGLHIGIDLVGTGRTLDYIVAHSNGTVVNVRSDYKTNDTTGSSYGNYVLIKHSNGYYTLYAHMKYGSVTVKKGDKVTKGQVIGYMGNTGHSFGAHLHFEVRNTSNVQINPTPYINANLLSTVKTTSISTKPNFKVGANYKTQVILKVRTGPGTNYSQKKYSQLTANAKTNAYSSGANAGCLKHGTVVTCQEVKNVDNDIWIKIPSGWIAGYYNGQVYVK